MHFEQILTLYDAIYSKYVNDILVYLKETRELLRRELTSLQLVSSFVLKKNK